DPDRAPHAHGLLPHLGRRGVERGLRRAVPLQQLAQPLPVPDPGQQAEFEDRCQLGLGHRRLPARLEVATSPPAARAALLPPPPPAPAATATPADPPTPAGRRRR